MESFVKNIVHNLAGFPRFLARIVLILGFSAVACAAQAQEPLKVAVIDMAAALFNSELAKQVNEEIKQETAEDEERVRSLAQEATTLQEKLQKDASIMSDDEKRKAQEKIEEIGVQYQYLVQKLQSLMQERTQQFQQTYAPNLSEAITAVVEEEDFDLVLRANAALYWRNTYDITARVTAKLNEQQ